MKSKKLFFIFLPILVLALSSSLLAATKHWSTFKNDFHQFEIRYPSAWSLPSSSAGRYFINDGKPVEGCCSGLEIRVSDESADRVYKATLANIGKGNVLSDKVVTFATLPARELVLKTNFGANEHALIVSRGSYTYYFSMADGDALAAEILSSFKFSQ